MPSPYTHYLCGMKMLELPEVRPVTAIVSKHLQIFNLGTQGPDILFYYRAWPWTDSQGIGKVGEKMHEEKVGALFENALDYAANRNEVEKKMLLAYLCGYACHYSLDLFTHPYIIYKTGFDRTNGKETDKYTYYHRIFETAVDVLMLKRILHKNPVDLKLHELLSVSKDAVQAIGRMYEYVIHRVYGMKVSAKQVGSAVSDMLAIHSVLRDRTGLKKKLLSWAEIKMGNYPLMASMIYPVSVNDSNDYLNSGHYPWTLPWDDSAVSAMSFAEMFQLAVKEAGELSERICCFLKEESDLNTTLLRLGSRSFTTGLDCSLKPELRYFDCIFESGAV